MYSSTRRYHLLFFYANYVHQKTFFFFILRVLAHTRRYHLLHIFQKTPPSLLLYSTGATPEDIIFFILYFRATCATPEDTVFFILFFHATGVTAEEIFFFIFYIHSHPQTKILRVSGYLFQVCSYLRVSIRQQLKRKRSTRLMHKIIFRHRNE